MAQFSDLKFAYVQGNHSAEGDLRNVAGHTLVSIGDPEIGENTYKAQGLTPGTLYSCQAIGLFPDGSEDLGSIYTFATPTLPGETIPQDDVVETLQATTTSPTEAMLNGAYDERTVHGDELETVSFLWAPRHPSDQTPASLEGYPGVQETPPQLAPTASLFDAQLSSLDDATPYLYQARGERASDQQWVTHGSVQQFVTPPAAPVGTWTEQTSGTTNGLRGVAAPPGNELVAWAVGLGSTVLKTTNGGASWVLKNNGIPAGQTLTTVKAIDANTAFIVSDNYRVYLTTNGGTNWSETSLLPFRPDDIAIGETGGNRTIYLSGQNLSNNDMQVAVSTNDGASWVKKNVGDDGRGYGAASKAATVMWVAGLRIGGNGSRAVYKTVNSGASFVAVDADLNGDVSTAAGYLGLIADIDGDSDEVWVVGGTTGGMFLAHGVSTSDFVVSWTNQAPNVAGGTPTQLNRVVAFARNLAWAVGPGGTVLFTNNSGLVWRREDLGGATPNLRAVAAPTAEKIYAVGSTGRIFTAHYNHLKDEIETAGATPGTDPSDDWDLAAYATMRNTAAPNDKFDDASMIIVEGDHSNTESDLRDVEGYVELAIGAPAEGLNTVNASGLDPSTQYSYQAIGQYVGGGEDRGQILTFTTTLDAASTGAQDDQVVTLQSTPGADSETDRTLLGSYAPGTTHGDELEEVFFRYAEASLGVFPNQDEFDQYENMQETTPVEVTGSPQSMQAELTGLIRGTTYYYQAVGRRTSDQQWEALGQLQNFTTDPQPAASQYWAFQQSGSTKNLYGVAAPPGNDLIAWAVGSDSTILKSVDGGVSWVQQSVPGSAKTLRSVVAIDDQTVIVTGSTNRVYRTTDGGATWTYQSFPDGSGQSFRGVDQAEGILIAAGSTGRVERSVNDGVSWASQFVEADDATYYHRDVSMVDGLTAYLVTRETPTSQLRVYRTKDGGQTWTERVAPPGDPPSSFNNLPRSITAPSTNAAWVVGGNEGSGIPEIRYSVADGDGPWIDQTPNIIGVVDVLYGVHSPRVRPTFAVAVGNYGTIVSTYNSGNGWIKEVVRTENHLQDVFFPTGRKGYAVGDDGTILTAEYAGTNEDLETTPASLGNDPSTEWNLNMLVLPEA